MTAPKPQRPRRTLVALVSVALAAALGLGGYAGASVMGEENATLIQILAETAKVTDEMRELNDTMDATAEVVTDLRDTYARVNAGIDELADYSFDHFRDDLTDDLYDTYPGIAHGADASAHLAFWEDTRAHSPFTAYEAITAVAGDLTQGLRDDVRAGRANVDHELILRGEGAGSLALAAASEDATRAFDRAAIELARFARDASPGQAEQLSARALVLLAAEESHIIRLLSRTVRLEGVDKVLAYKSRIEARNAAYDDRLDGAPVVADAVRPPLLLDLDELE